MFLKPGRKGAGAAMAASLAMVATPAIAAEPPLPQPSHAAIDAYDFEAGNADHYRRYRDRDDGIGAGEVIAGILVLGGIAAIASAVGGDGDDRPRRYPAERAEPPFDDEAHDTSGIARAVDMCVDQIERGRERVARVEDAVRDPRGWRVSGELANGDPFTCRIGNDGRISEVETGDRSGPAFDRIADRRTENRQHSDEIYARLRAGQGSAELRRAAPVGGDLHSDELRPAYPGGPFPGEEGYEDHAGDRRYGAV